MDTERSRRARTSVARVARLGRSQATRRARWKARELAVAEYVGGVRVPVTGRSRGSAPDVDHPWLSLEVKAWERLPERVADALRQAEAANLTGAKLPAAIIVANGAQLRSAMVVLRLSDFMEWFGSNAPPIGSHIGAQESNGLIE